MGATYQVGLDIGGTFTDPMLTDGHGPPQLHKILTTPDDPAVGALTGLWELLERAGLGLGDIKRPDDPQVSRCRSIQASRAGR